MRLFLLFFICLSCCAAGESDGWLWRALSSVKSRASGLTKALTPCDQDSTLRFVCDSFIKAKNYSSQKVRLMANYWWYKAGRIEKACDVYLCAMFVFGSVVLVGMAPALYGGAWSLLPACVYASSGCTFTDFALVAFNTHTTGVAVSLPFVCGCVGFYKKYISHSTTFPGDFSQA